MILQTSQMRAKGMLQALFVILQPSQMHTKGVLQALSTILASCEGNKTG